MAPWTPRAWTRPSFYTRAPKSSLWEWAFTLSFSLSYRHTQVRYSLLHFSSRAAPLAAPRVCNFFVYENRYFTANHQHFGGVEKTFVIHRVSPRVMRASRPNRTVYRSSTPIGTCWAALFDFDRSFPMRRRKIDQLLLVEYWDCLQLLCTTML